MCTTSDMRMAPIALNASGMNMKEHRYSNMKSRRNLIGEAIEIINSSQQRGPLRRKGSSLSERRANELLKDNSDCLSELLRKSQGGLVDLSSDDESDLED
ncbi:unnamed protein product [Cylindrotheca closterium]|uniref:Uncharacterized protein n=1 Tax=Cylindrotheca closterium TaxID=2856 RepID=A0AAD2CPZ8_9STRA|nr:unnamed protein product [Cylindrotheca closterium]